MVAREMAVKALRRAWVFRALVIGLLLMVSAQTAIAADPQPDADGWYRVAVPESWRRPFSGPLAAQGGYGWFRCAVVVPPEWKSEQVHVLVEPVDDARGVYVNGANVGVLGTFPPRFRSGLGEPGRFRVPAKLLRFGERNVIAVRAYRSDGRNNFSVAPPVLYTSAAGIRMQGEWLYRPGDDRSWAKLPVSAAGAVYDKVDAVKDLESYLRRRKGDHDPFPPAAALAEFRVPDDLVLEQPVAEPAVRQPLFMNFDERGRLWVLQYLQYPTPAGLRMVSRDQHLRTVYDKVPLAPPHHVRGRDKITIHEDTDGDGRYDRHRTFVDGLNIATSFARGRGGLWVLNPPYLLFYPDLNNDDVPDADPEVHLRGFGMEDTHSVVNSLRWGPDGWLYAAQGSTVTGQITVVGSGKPATHSMGQLIWRYHPEWRVYEVFAEGGGNTFGVEIDARGRTFSGTNGGDSRGYHYVQGGYARKGFGKHGSLSNPYAFGYFAAMKHNKVPRFTHNFVIYEGAVLPERYRGRLFGIEPLQGQVVLSDVSRDGSTFQTRDLSRPVLTDDQWFRPVDIKLGPDGGIYIADLYEQRIDHSSHFAGRVTRDSGRVYRLTRPDAPRLQPFDYGRLSSQALVDVLEHPNRWHRQQALRLIGDRRDRSLIPLLEEKIASADAPLALEYLWAVNLSGGLDERLAGRLLKHSDSGVRAWTVRLMCDDRRVGQEFANQLAAMARDEGYVDVRSQLACSARRLPAAHAMPILKGLLTHDEDLADPHLPLLLWWILEAHAETNRDAVLTFFADPQVWGLPLVEQTLIERIIKRYALAGARRDLLTCARLLNSAPDRKHAARMMKSFEQAFQGRSLVDLPDELVAAINTAGGASLALQVRQGDAAAIARALRDVADPKVGLQSRLQLIQTFGEIRRPECGRVLVDLLQTEKNSNLVQALLAALVSYDDPRIADVVLKRVPGLKPDDRRAAEMLLSSRRAWGRQLVAAVEQGRLAPQQVAPAAVRRVLLHDDPGLKAAVKKIWGHVQGATTEEMQERIRTLATIVADGSGNPYKGRSLFRASCGNCHVLFGQGGQIGPDLTAYKRDDMQRMLLNIVNPSAEIREGFENYVVLTSDGRILNGFRVDQDERIVVLRGADGRNQVVERSQIEEMQAVQRSMMPDGLLKKLTAQEVRDLFAFLRGTQPLP